MKNGGCLVDSTVSVVLYSISYRMKAPKSDPITKSAILEPYANLSLVLSFYSTCLLMFGLPRMCCLSGVHERLIHANGEMTGPPYP